MTTPYDEELRAAGLDPEAVVAQIRATACIDPKRVYASGFSNGGSFTSRLVQERSTVIAAAGVGSAQLKVDPMLAERPMSVMHWIGNRDDKFLPPGMPQYPVTESILDDPSLPFRVRFVAPFLTTLGLEDSYTFSDEPAGGHATARFTFAKSTTGGGNTYVSSAMPQKRNPGLLNNTLRDASTAIALAQGVVMQAHNITPGMGDPKEVKANQEMVNSAIVALRQWDAVLNGLVVSPERALEELNSDWTASQELADLLSNRQLARELVRPRRRGGGRDRG